MISQEQLEKGSLIPKAGTKSTTTLTLDQKETLIPKAGPSTKSKFELIPKSTTTGSDKVLLQVISGTNGHSVEIFHMLSPTQTFPYFDNCIKCGFQSHEITMGNAVDTARRHVGF
jgi:hypothetical protein